MVLEDIRKTFEALIGQLTPAKAQQLAKRFLEPEAAREQVAKTAGELVELSQRMREAVRKEVVAQMRSMGVATQAELDALRKRVRDLERAAGGVASRRSTATKSSAKSAAKTGGRAKTSGSRASSRAKTGSRSSATAS